MTNGPMKLLSCYRNREKLRNGTLTARKAGTLTSGHANDQLTKTTLIFMINYSNNVAPGKLDGMDLNDI